MTNNEIVMQGSPSMENGFLMNISGESANDKNYALKTAGFWVRFWAFLLDGFIISAIGGILVNPIFYLMDWSLSDSVWYAPISIITAIFYYSYFVLMTKFFGQTLGKMVFGLRVISLKHDQLTWSDVLFRDWIGRIINNIFMPLYILVVILPENQGLHDYFADTTVVHEKIFIEKASTPTTLPKQEEQIEAIVQEEKIDLAKLEEKNEQ
ncbi:MULTISPECIES: RDD family protein [Lysinibacillus]|uniref:RDD family protein n=1 Tax=Lysinibacillus TaxID=400634 RepID=UPI0021A7C06B|nr:RDD family protein [Lysinibacillus capsici]MCT1538194.1 RDD family protein [Lysinibacillus capsici]MCT1570026.1 RDD family protein [Lysinibacillus capsici]MCT1646856.1 RDD family protein [Lysinibacillus capsici]MCT1724472.1 RDD family protein [Lysinibacillus capsici]MCT1782502.1 RDD family protein [Lysinibacillus capsici]